ncbi:class I SAM-dependent methyltransferase [Ramlibacter cellulosilyticus]
MESHANSVTSALHRLIAGQVARSGGWLPFDRYMALALYAPGLGYYANTSRKFGTMPGSGSDFATAPEMSPLFGQCLAVQVDEALQKTDTSEIWEFGAGSGALARELLQVLHPRVRRYTIVELSAALRERQQQALAPFADQVEWVSELPEKIRGVVVGNEVLDAMPVKLVVRKNLLWHERGVTVQDGKLAWSDVLTHLRPPHEPPGTHDYLTELHHQAQAFLRTLAERLDAGAAFFIDYGFPEAEYYHAQRHMGTLMCHRGHMADPDPLDSPGEKDITSHVDFTGIAVAAQEAGLPTLGYASQGRFLVNCGIVERMASLSVPQQAAAQRLVAEHEMGELFKVIGFQRGAFWNAIGFRYGDRTHAL